MKKQKILYMLGAACLLTASVASAQQVLLPGTSIPKFALPLPEAGAISVYNDTSLGLVGGALGPGAAIGPHSGIVTVEAAKAAAPTSTVPFNISAREFRSQMLPPGTCDATQNAFNSASATFGYLLDSDQYIGVTRPSYLGPVVVAERNIGSRPTYKNMLPQLGVVQSNLAIDMTLDWANPQNIDCWLTLDGFQGGVPYDNPACGIIPYIGPMPIATHIHGGEVGPAYDGGPDAWTVPGNTITGAGFPGEQYFYPNEQQESTIWFHDHALGITRLNVYAGLAGLWPIIDPANPPLTEMPAFPAYDVPLIIQDRSFDTNCEIFYNLASNPQPNPDIHPFWIPEFLGDTIAVNGAVWPFMEVEPRQYRFRYVNGSNARFYELTFNEVVTTSVTRRGRTRTTTRVSTTPIPQLAIATDDGYLDNAVSVPMVILGNGERYEVIFDFSGMAGKEIRMMNSARTPYPGGEPVIPGNTDTIMQFRVVKPLSAVPDSAIAAGSPIRSTPNMDIKLAHDTFTGLPATGSITRQLTLNEFSSDLGPLEMVVNNSKYNSIGILPGSTTPLGRETELPAVGDTEIWEIINITADAHPMHTHLVSFKVLDRTPFLDAEAWIVGYEATLLANGGGEGTGPPNQYNVRNVDGAIGGNPPIYAALDMANRRGPEAFEVDGWKDVVVTYPGEMTRIAVRWAPTDHVPNVLDVGTDYYSVNVDPMAAINGIGYVWHCHIVDHEDNEMMRNYLVMPTRQPVI